jgi:hypothetical protein
LFDAFSVGYKSAALPRVSLVSLALTLGFNVCRRWRPERISYLMQDTKNIMLAGLSSLTSFFAVIETQTLITIISAIILPILFFCVGKAVDVMVQIRFRQMAERRKTREIESLNQ